MKHVYLILAAMMLLCLTPMPYGYFQLVRFVATVAFGIMAYQYYMKQKTVAQCHLLPQRFVLPPSGHPHCGRVNVGVFGKQRLNVVSESINRIDCVEPVGDAAELGVEFKRMEVSVGNPRQSGLSGQFRHDRETAVPDTGMVGALVSQDGDTGQPTAKDEVLRQSEVLCHQIFCRVVGKVGVEFRDGAKRQDFKRLPCWRKLWSVVFRKMFRYEVFLRTLYLSTDMSNVGLETFGIFAQSFISKPKRIMASREIANHLTTCGDFYLEDSIEDELLQFGVETVDGNDFIEMGIGLKDMALSVNLHRTPIVGQAEIARPVKDGRCLCFIVNNKPPLFQSFNLLGEGEGLLGIVHTEKTKSRPVALPVRGRVPGSIGCKGTIFNREFQMFWQKSA